VAVGSHLRRGCFSFNAPSSAANGGSQWLRFWDFRGGNRFAPETIEILAVALEETWERLQRSGSRLTRPAYSRVMREVIAKRIVETAQCGVQDREALVTDAIQFIATNYEQPSELAT
jgi:hypothetical protein